MGKVTSVCPTEDWLAKVVAVRYPNEYSPYRTTKGSDRNGRC